MGEEWWGRAPAAGMGEEWWARRVVGKGKSASGKSGSEVCSEKRPGAERVERGLRRRAWGRSRVGRTSEARAAIASRSRSWTVRVAFASASSFACCRAASSFCFAITRRSSWIGIFPCSCSRSRLTAIWVERLGGTRKPSLANSSGGGRCSGSLTATSCPATCALSCSVCALGTASPWPAPPPVT